MSLLQPNVRKVSPRPFSAPPRPSPARPRPISRVKKDPSASFQLSLLDRAHQQAAVAALGQAALTGVELPMLLDQAAVFISQTLSLDFSSIYQLSDDSSYVRMVSGCGWNADIGAIVLPTDPGTMCS